MLQQDPKIATGAGHHSVIRVPNTDDYYVVYHRRPLRETDGNSRVTCIDRMEFDEAGLIKPIRITHEGVPVRAAAVSSRHSPNAECLALPCWASSRGKR